MPRFYAYTIRNGRHMHGNANQVGAIWSDLKTTTGAFNRAKQWAKRLAKPGDIICIERAADHEPYVYSHVGQFIHTAK